MKIKSSNEQSTGNWIEQWMQSVANDDYTMSQRKLSSIRKREISLDEIIAEAKKYHVHLLLLKDDKGEELIAASKDEFTVLC